MSTHLFRFSDILCKLIKAHFYIARQALPGKIINFYVWAFCSLVVMGYIMQEFGLASDYGCFQLATVIGTVGLFEVYGNSFRCIVDFEGDRYISYLLTLPLSPAIVWWSMICSYTLIGIILSLVMLPFGKLLLGNSFSFANVSWFKFIVMLILANIFYGVFTIAVTAHVGAMSKMENVWSRFIFPLWFLGGFQFSWASVYKLSQPLAYVLLCNPILFVMEGTRAALLGQGDCLPWGICCAVLCGFIIVGWLYGNYKMKRLLDFV
jgi:ABC-type polysaccharide/polyol phosphate export permease